MLENLVARRIKQQLTPFHNLFSEIVLNISLIFGKFVKLKSFLYQLQFSIHPGLTRVRSIRFHLFEIKRVLVYNNFLTYGFVCTLLFKKNAYADKKVFKKKG